MTKSDQSFVRFSLSARLQHILIMVSFTVLGITGLPQKFSSLDWARWLVNAMGGIEGTRIVHRVTAIVLVVTIAYHVLRELYRIAIKGQRFDMRPRLRDLKDLAGNLAFLAGARRDRPRFDRFSYMEKFEYWAVAWGMFSIAVTGVFLWFPALVTRLLPGWSVPMAKAAHGGEALLAVLAIIVWHLYNTHLKPRNFPMNTSVFTGRISAHEMMTEHPMEFERITGQRVPDETINEKARLSWPILATSGVLGVFTVALFVSMVSWVIHPPTPSIPVHQERAREGQRQLLQPAPTPWPTPEEMTAARVWTAAGVKAPMADFRAAPAAPGQASAAPIGTVQFTNLSGGEIATYAWDFGDGTTSNERDPQHTYLQCPDSLCSVTLTVCGPGGCAVETKRDYLRIAP
jgi:formate dehydrogenase subunit gamma